MIFFFFLHLFLFFAMRFVFRLVVASAVGTVTCAAVSYIIQRGRERAGGRAQRMSGKVALVTGGTGGIGRLLAFR